MPLVVSLPRERGTMLRAHPRSILKQAMDTWRQRQYIELNQRDTVKFKISKHADQVDVALGQGGDYNSVEQEMDHVLYCIQGRSK